MSVVGMHGAETEGPEIGPGLGWERPDCEAEEAEDG
jgi:hypothetical protein